MLGDALRGMYPGYFTLVMATGIVSDVLGLRLHLRGEDHLALVLWLGALSIWIALGAWLATMLGLLASARAHLRAARPVAG